MLNQLVRLVAFDLPDDYFTTYSEEVGKLTLADIHRVAEEHIKDGALKVVVAGDAESVGAGTARTRLLCRPNRLRGCEVEYVERGHSNKDRIR